MYSITKSGIGNNKLQDTCKKQIAKAFPKGGTIQLKSETEAARRMSAKIRNEINEEGLDEKTGAWYWYDSRIMWVNYFVPIKHNRVPGQLSQTINLADNNMHLKYDCNYRNYDSLAQSLNYDDSDKKFHFLHQKLYPYRPEMNCNLDNTRSEVYIDSLKQHCNIYYQNDSDCIKIPKPVLKTENGVSKTIYKNSSGNLFKALSLMNPIDLKFEDLKNVVLKLEERKNDEELRFEYRCLRLYDSRVFCIKLDKLVEKANDAIRTARPSAKMIKVYLEDGERMDVTKLVEDASIFNITLYNEKNEVTLDGEFYCCNDRNGNILKYNSKGKLVNSDDANYNNPNNVLNYDWKGSIHGLRKFMGQEYVKQGRENLKAIKTIEKQYEVIKKFENCRGTVFDEPVELAKKAYDALKEDKTTNLIDLNDDGSRIEFWEIENPKDLDPNKHGYTILLTSYDKENRKSMQGMFTLLRDNNGNPLKENKEGKIFKPGDPDYDNEDNKLCFDIDHTMYYSDLDDVPKLNFSRKINLNEKKQRHTMSAQQFDRNRKKISNIDSTFNFTLPKYSKDWAKGRLCKMHYETSKKDLKEIKADFEHNMLCPQDLNLIKITNENAASLLAKNKKEILDFPTEIATTAYKYVKQHPDCFHDKNKYQRINLADGKFIDVRKHEVYNDNQSHYEIILYNRDSKKTMKGLFLFSNGEYLLKENNEGKIFQPNELGYDNQDNKLCFPMWYEVLTPDTGKKTFEFMRDIRDSGERKVHRIIMQQFDGNDNFVSGTTQAAGIKLEQILPNPEV